MITTDTNRRSSCRLCGKKKLIIVLALTPTPLANAFVPGNKLGDVQPVLPLDIFFCETCGHVQLLDVVDPRVLFSNYLYVSGTSPVFVDHFRRYAESVLARYAPYQKGLVVDIGSNDGTFLSFFKKAGMTVQGVDPASNIVEVAERKGIKTIVGFFDRVVADNILTARGKAQVITANNVFAHVDDLGRITEGIRLLLSPDGVFVFEVSYLFDIVRKTLFDTIYHEHLSYHSVEPIRNFFFKQGLEMIDAYRVDTHGGSLRGVCQLAGGKHPVKGSVDKLITREREIGLNKAGTYKKFFDNIGEIKKELKNLLSRLKSEGKTLAGYGAPAKATTLMYHFEIGPDIIDYIVDDSPLKQGHYSPGMHIPIVSTLEIKKKTPDYLLLLAWNFAESIMSNNHWFRNKGGRFIVPLPRVKIY